MKKLIIGNWKMNPTSQKEAEILFKSILSSITKNKNTDVVLCVPFVYLQNVAKVKSKSLLLGAQDTFYEEKGAFTGEISSKMLAGLGVKYVIVGHSERRSLGETNEIVNKKIRSILKNGMTPILCVGETERSHDGMYLNYVKDQILVCLKDIPKNQIKNIVIAYEPVWALSSTVDRHDATPHDFEEMKIFIRKILSDMSSPQTGSMVKILYGGSANKDNTESFLKVGADGLLPGKASLDSKNFSKIVQIASTIK